MKKFMILLLIAGLFSMNAYSQSAGTSTPMAVETLMIKAKRGMEEKFEEAVKAHNTKFHPEGPYVAGLRKIEYGERAGWYVWVFGPAAYGSLDTRPTKENGHEADWNDNIDPLVEEYGASGFWDYKADLSFGLDIFKKAKNYETWQVDLKPKQYYRFKALIEKLKKVYETDGKTAFLVLDNNLHSKGGTDVALVWSFETYQDWQQDPGPKATYEKLYGTGSWQMALDEWMDMINDYSSEIRSNVR